jgi:hypothetical protein
MPLVSVVSTVPASRSPRAARSRRAIAAIAGLWLLVVGTLGFRHEAQVAHVVDPRTGELWHGSALVGTHSGTDSDYHATRDRDRDTDACEIAAALHQAATSLSSWQVALPAPALVSTQLESCAPSVGSELVYRLAPKTSPPSRA